MTLLINKDDLGKYVQFSTNVFSSQINFHIRDAQNIDISPLLPAQMISDLGTLIVANPNAFDRNKNYLAGEIVFTLTDEQRTFYKALVNTNAVKPPSAQWALHELLNFWENYIKPLQAVSAFGRYLVEGGVHVAQGGFREHLDNTSTEISSTRRAEMIRQNAGRIGFYKANLENYLKDVKYTFDGTKYVDDACKTGSGRKMIIAVGSKNIWKTRKNRLND